MTSFKNKEETYLSLKDNFEKRVGDTIQVGSVIDIFLKSIADECGDMYQYIEDNKNPHLFTNTWGEDLDSLGYWVNLPRKYGESDNVYKYRLKDWLLTVESSNTIAISSALLNPEYASNIEYVPYTRGSGTGTVYIIPKVYEEECIVNALKEAKTLVAGVVSPSLYIEYVVPTMRAVSLECYMTTYDDEETIRNNIARNIQEYVNSIPPGEYLELGKIARIGINENGVDYFDVLTLIIDEEPVTVTKVVQELETKFIFDNIVWRN